MLGRTRKECSPISKTGSGVWKLKLGSDRTRALCSLGMFVPLTLSRLKVKYNRTARPEHAAPSSAPKTVTE